jgi:alpha-L-fucosidase 2
MQHYWNHYEFNQDASFLKHRAYPAMHEVVQFYSDWLIKDPRDGTLISAPSTSPENRYLNKAGNKVASCLGSAMDQQIIFEVFTNYLKASHILGIEDAFTLKINNQLQALRPGFVLSDDGKILEWDRPYQEPEPGHRHISHLYGFHPGNAVTKTKTPQLFEAVKKTLQYRLDNGGAGTGWSRAWLINCSARLLDGEMAHKHIDLLLKKSMSNNLFDRHPPFQIDGNFGYTAGVVEMLLQSHEDGIIRVLPALPKAWKAGSIKGLKAKGGLTVSLFWSNHQLDQVTIEAKNDVNFNLIYNNKATPISLKKGKNHTLNY